MLGRSALLAATNVVDYGNWLGNYNNVSLLLRNGTPQLVPFDESPTPKTIAAVGDASVTTAVARWNQGSGGSSLAFDGSGDSLTAPSGADFNFGTSPFTVECWARHVNVGSGFEAYFSLVTGTFGAQGFVIGKGSSNQLQFIFYNTSNSPTFAISSANSALQNNTWYHIAVTRDSTNVFRLFLDGVRQGTDVTSTASMFSGKTPTIGDWTDSGGPLNGYIDDLRITKGIARYTSNFSPPNTELPANITDDPDYNSVSLLLRNGTPSTTLVPFDESPIATRKTINTVGSATITTAQFQYGDSSLNFDGTNSMFVASSSTDFDLAGVDWTIEFWIRPIAFAGFQSPLAQALYQWRIDIASGVPRFYTDPTFTSNTALTLNVWQHLAITSSGGTGRMFINGVQTGGGPVSLSATGASEMRIGALAFGSFYYPMTGQLDDVRITKGIARYTSNFTPPPAELPNF